MSAGRPEAMDGLPEALRREVDEWILSHAHHSAASVYRKFNLVERGIKPRTFRGYVERLREQHKGEVVPQPAAESGLKEADTLLIDLMIEKAFTGETKHFLGIASALRALADRRRLTIDEFAEKRAAELHDIKIEQLSKDIRRDVEARTEDGKTLSREDVYDMIDKIMRGE